MKKLLAFLLLAAMLVTFAACDKDKGDTAASGGSMNDSSVFAPEASQNTADDTEFNGIRGTYSDSARTYVNNFVGIGCKLGTDWDVFNDDQIAQLNGMMADLVNDADISKLLQKNGNAMVFYAQKNEGLVTLNIGLENLGKLYGSTLDEQQYANRSVGQLVTALESLGLTDITTRVGTTTLAGSEHVAVFVKGSLQGVEFYETLVCVKTGNYMTIITAGSYLTDETGDSLSLFYGL